MPVTDFQKEVLLLLKENRSKESFIAGGIAINRDETSNRFSDDVDFFHDIDEAVQHAVTADKELLLKNGYEIEEVLNQPSFVRLVVSKGDESLRLDWARDTAFRFFPLQEDDLLGFRLSDIDLAVNKVLALANRSEVRDVLDVLVLHKKVISLTHMIIASVGKDPGFTPDLLLSQLRRNSVISAEHLSGINTKEPLDPTELKKEWLTLLDKTEEALKAFKEESLGFIYLEKSGRPVKNPDPAALKTLTRVAGKAGEPVPEIN